MPFVGLLAGLMLFLGMVDGTAAGEPTACDLLASHPDDPDHLGPGVESEAMDRQSALEACLEAVARNPDDPRAQYQLGRVWFYLGHTDAGLPHLRASADQGYAQAIFVLGYVHATGYGGLPPDLCRAAGLWLRSVEQDHPWSAWHLVDREVRGDFAPCDIALTPEQLERWMLMAQQHITPEASAGRVEALAERHAMWVRNR